MAYSAKIIADSVSESQIRLTTFEVTFPRIVLAEWNTHRAFCLAGDSTLEFDLPTGSRGGKYRRVYRMRIDEFVDKWHNGARRYASNPKREVDLSRIDLDKSYTAGEVASILGFSNATNINGLCRSGHIPAVKRDREWVIQGVDVHAWRLSSPLHTRFDIQSRLRSMRIRQLNEKTGDIQTSYVTNAIYSGRKRVLEVRAGDYYIRGSADHIVYTMRGQTRVADLTRDDILLVRKFGKRDAELLDPLRLKKIEGKWRGTWQRDIRKKMQEVDTLCRRCRDFKGTQVHHIIPVYVDPTRAFDAENITLVCDDCHEHFHRTQDWQGGTYLYASGAQVESIVECGDEDTYDLSIAGEFPNFLANGVVVHNSRNSASSRAIPVEKIIEKVKNDPFIPIYWGKNQKGMQANEALTPVEQAVATIEWLQARNHAVDQAERLRTLGVHKQITNRLLEPFLWHTVICSATEWDNFFALRCHPDAQPEIRTIAVMMRDLYLDTFPTPLQNGEWHLPYVLPDEREQWTKDDPARAQLALISSARCARVSYLTHDGRRDIDADLALAKRLEASGHMSPFEHPALAVDSTERFGNFKGWKQFRKFFIHEENYGGRDHGESTD